MAAGRREAAEGKRFVNYRDMSVQQLIFLYRLDLRAELLEREPVREDGDGKIVIRPNPYACLRKDSGSFFTTPGVGGHVIGSSTGREPVKPSSGKEERLTPQA